MIALEQMENNFPLRQIIEKHADALGCTPKALHHHWDRADASLKVKEHAARRLSSLQLPQSSRSLALLARRIGARRPSPGPQWCLKTMSIPLKPC